MRVCVSPDMRRSVAASYSHMQIQSVQDTARVAEATQRAAAGGRDAMAALEAQAAAAAPATGGTKVRGFVSAGVIQQGNPQQQVRGKTHTHTHTHEVVSLVTCLPSSQYSCLPT